MEGKGEVSLGTGLCVAEKYKTHPYNEVLQHRAASGKL